MKQISKVLWGLLFILVGVIWALNAFEITHINLFFDGWWTLFIIVPCFIGLFDSEGKTGNFIGLVIGVALLCSAQGLISFDLIAKLIVPLVFIMIGLSFLFNEWFKGEITKKVKKGNEKGLSSIVATFSDQKVVKEEEFEGADLEAIFGAVTLDLRKATLKDETVIQASSIFGGIEVLLPDDVKVEVKSTSIFGGVSNKYIKSKDNKKIVYLEAFCLFGGVDIK